jgi:hypothetical protein
VSAHSTTSPFPRQAPGRRWLPACLGIAAALQLVVVNHWPGFASPNERARAYQAIAIASRGSLAIDAEVARFGAMEDSATVGGRLYPNKAPGTTLLVVPAAVVARLVAGGGDAELAITLVLGRLLASSLPFLLTALLLARHLRESAPAGAAVAVAAFTLASPALTASLLLFSHTLVAFLLLGAFVLLYSGRPELWRAAIAGAAVGWAATAEYPAIVPGAVLVLIALPRLRLAGGLAVAAGGAVPAAALAAYNRACFGSPFALSSGHETHAAYVELASHGLFGVGAPSPAALLGLLVSPARGLLVWLPVVALAAAGVRRRGGGERAALVLAPLALLVAMAGYPNWHGGWFPGPRYLLATLPFLLVLAGRGAEMLLGSRPWRVAIGAALLWGGAQTWVSLAAFPFPPEDYPLPAVTFALPLLRAGVLIPSWLPGPAFAVALTLLAAAAALVVLAAALPDRPLSERVVALAIAGTALAAALALPRPVSWQSRLEWAAVHDLYSGPPRRGALEALAPACETLTQRAQLSRWLAARDRAAAQRNTAVPGTEF